MIDTLDSIIKLDRTVMDVARDVCVREVCAKVGRFLSASRRQSSWYSAPFASDARLLLQREEPGTAAAK